nr:hypothetical protein [Veronia pacifica]
MLFGGAEAITQVRQHRLITHNTGPLASPPGGTQVGVVDEFQPPRGTQLDHRTIRHQCPAKPSSFCQHRLQLGLEPCQRFPLRQRLIYTMANIYQEVLRHRLGDHKRLGVLFTPDLVIMPCKAVPFGP